MALVLVLEFCRSGFVVGLYILALVSTLDADHFTVRTTTRITHDNKKNEVDPVPERMSVLYVIHDIHPAFQADHLSHDVSGARQLLTNNIRSFVN